MLLDEPSAAKQLGRSWTTVRDWRLNGDLRVAHRDGRGRPLYESRDLLACARKMRANYEARRVTPGTGRGRRHPDTSEIRARLMAGESTRAIVEAIGCSETTVRRNRREMALEEPENTSEGP